MSNNVESLPTITQDHESLLIFRDVCSRDAHIRKDALDTVCKNIVEHIQNSNDKSKYGDDVGSATGYAKVTSFLPELFKQAHTSPFTDVRERCQVLLTHLKVMSRKIVVSNITFYSPYPTSYNLHFNKIT